LSLPWSSGVAVDGRSGVLLWRSESAPAGSASSLSKRDSRTSLYLRGVSVAGKRNSEPRDNSAENACSVSLVSAETRTRAAEPANSGPFGSSQEISPKVELPGGPGRIRTSNQTVMSGGIKVAAVDFPEHLAEVERVCNVSLRSFLVRNWCGNRQARDYCRADTAADNKFKSRSRNTRWLRNVKGDPSRSPSAVSQESVVAGARNNRFAIG
jgi:hypothetical protein